MHVIAKKALIDFYEKQTTARDPRLVWHRLALKCDAENLADLKKTFAIVDYVPPNFYVFDVDGNKYRVIATVHFDRQKMFNRHVLTHSEYDDWSRKNRRK